MAKKKKSKPKKSKKGKQEKPAESIYDTKECPDCASQNLVYNEERQQIICRDCGLIYEPLAPDVEKQFKSSHEPAPVGGEAPERIMVRIAAEEKPKKARKKPRKAAKKPVKKAKRAKARKKPAKKKAKPKKPKAKKKSAKPKAAKKLAKKKPAKPARKKSGLMGLLKSRLKKKR